MHETQSAHLWTKVWNLKSKSVAEHIKLSSEHMLLNVFCVSFSSLTWLLWEGSEVLQRSQLCNTFPFHQVNRCCLYKGERGMMSTKSHREASWTPHLVAFHWCNAYGTVQLLILWLRGKCHTIIQHLLAGDLLSCVLQHRLWICIIAAYSMAADRRRFQLRLLEL